MTSKEVTCYNIILVALDTKLPFQAGFKTITNWDKINPYIETAVTM